MLRIVNSTSVLVQWSEPTVPNGNITSYMVNISRLNEVLQTIVVKREFITLTMLGK